MRGHSITIVGIDPGLIATGYGVVLADRGSYRSTEHGVFRPDPRAPLGERLLELQRSLRELLARCHPDAVAIEEPFVGANTRSALMLGRAQAAALIAAAEAGLPVFTYAPAQVKATVAGYGRGDKRQVAAMVRMQLGLADAPEPADAADALAVAICHAAHAERRMVEIAR